jgi:hypothetical protein
LQAAFTHRTEIDILRNPQEGTDLLAADHWFKKDDSKQGHDNLEERYEVQEVPN